MELALREISDEDLDALREFLKRDPTSLPRFTPTEKVAGKHYQAAAEAAALTITGRRCADGP
jgi:hypothetical protein